MATQHSDVEWSAAHGRAIRGAPPEVPAFTVGEQAALWRQVAATSAPRTRPGRAAWKVAVASLVTVGTIGGAGAAAADDRARAVREAVGSLGEIDRELIRLTEYQGSEWARR
ncbi:hypothetical protein [Nocardioides sp. cx-173]|uniref:hypothetical protein n=1 Tax=Nocardioides sp. cx-173 TaxID=2898796 RepID=UPI001E502FDA|nr:hypothetical protein [Nocardioides sp. cx-173]MCD4525714.1 hypothetical protein [Nocardioides sp. cx-173]UGB43962.1 hypothetical protein LQ940_10695 [Nocardioides sp. cx-173]